MQIDSASSFSLAAAAAGDGNAARIAALQKQLNKLTQQAKDVSQDDSLSADQKEDKQKLLQAQIQLINQQIQQLQAQDARRQQEQARPAGQAASAAPGSRPAARGASSVGGNVDTYA